MATRPVALTLLLLVSLAAADAAPGGWYSIPDVGAANVQELGRWALGQAKQAHLAGVGLQFRRVVWGEQQVVAGMNYRPFVDVTDPNGRSTPYITRVYRPVGTSPRMLDY